MKKLSVVILYLKCGRIRKFKADNVLKIEKSKIDDVEGWEVKTEKKGCFFFDDGEIQYILIAREGDKNAKIIN